MKNPWWAQPYYSEKVYWLPTVGVGVAGCFFGMPFIGAGFRILGVTGETPAWRQIVGTVVLIMGGELWSIGCRWASMQTRLNKQNAEKE